MARIKTLTILTGCALSAAVTLGGCTNIEQMPGPGNDRPKVCTKEYAPVCGAKGYKRKTFSNACMAQAKGYSVIKEGKCLG